MIEFTGLDGIAVMCVLIIQGKKRNLPIETGIDITVQSKGKPTVNFFLRIVAQESISRNHQAAMSMES